MKKSYKFRIYPTKNQEVKMVNTLNICRSLYNNSLEERIKSYELQKMDISEIKSREDLILRRRCNYISQANGLVELKNNHIIY